MSAALFLMSGGLFCAALGVLLHALEGRLRIQRRLDFVGLRHCLPRKQKSP